MTPYRFLSSIRLFAFLLLGITAVMAESSPPPHDFSAGLTRAERDAIGLASLSEAQIAALEAAVERYVAGRSEVAVAAATAEVRSEVSAAKAVWGDSGENDNTGFLERAKVLLLPGTKIEYAALSSRLKNEFRGWKPGTEFVLENGQIWRVTEGKYWSPQEDAGKAVTINPGAFGGFFIAIEGVRQTPKVMLVEGRP
ncbi:hypothetical protein [Synoicihabitans lomoniglobus]|uniref:Uncharacterized protein n=1 Tax=Synoicihabitans lomoniglobus TaxID=2909285 RepID=A0AAF0CMC6_9BACT|nr:hypothetical protein [Opitutaceae bacterium LMO-M01]WED63918.1 hypothetical protein PXH66_16395 [Opitutaceae bacterium LMO-M01]